jgi:hypothetical protein
VDGKTATLLLDGDLLFFGAVMIGLGFIFFLTISKIESYTPLIYVLACAVAVGAAARIYARMTYGNPGTAGAIPVVIESALPIFLGVLTYVPRREGGRSKTMIANTLGSADRANSASPTVAGGIECAPWS